MEPVAEWWEKKKGKREKRGADELSWAYYVQYTAICAGRLPIHHGPLPFAANKLHSAASHTPPRHPWVGAATGAATLGSSQARDIEPALEKAQPSITTDYGV